MDIAGAIKKCESQKQHCYGQSETKAQPDQQTLFRCAENYAWEAKLFQRIKGAFD